LIQFRLTVINQMTLKGFSPTVLGHEVAQGVKGLPKVAGVSKPCAKVERTPRQRNGGRGLQGGVSRANHKDTGLSRRNAKLHGNYPGIRL